MNTCGAPLKPTTDQTFKMDSNGFIINKKKSNHCIDLKGDRKMNSKYLTDLSVIFVLLL